MSSGTTFPTIPVPLCSRIVHRRDGQEICLLSGYEGRSGPAKSSVYFMTLLMCLTVMDQQTGLHSQFMQDLLLFSKSETKCECDFMAQMPSLASSPRQQSWRLGDGRRATQILACTTQFPIAPVLTHFMSI